MFFSTLHVHYLGLIDTRMSTKWKESSIFENAYFRSEIGTFVIGSFFTRLDYWPDINFIIPYVLDTIDDTLILIDWFVFFWNLKIKWKKSLTPRRPWAWTGLWPWAGWPRWVRREREWPGEEQWRGWRWWCGRGNGCRSGSSRPRDADRRPRTTRTCNEPSLSTLSLSLPSLSLFSLSLSLSLLSLLLSLFLSLFSLSRPLSPLSFFF